MKDTALIVTFVSGDLQAVSRHTACPGHAGASHAVRSRTEPNTAASGAILWGKHAAHAADAARSRAKLAGVVKAIRPSAHELAAGADAGECVDQAATRPAATSALGTGTVGALCPRKKSAPQSDAGGFVRHRLTSRWEAACPLGSRPGHPPRRVRHCCRYRYENQVRSCSHRPASQTRNHRPMPLTSC